MSCASVPTHQLSMASRGTAIAKIDIAILLYEIGVRALADSVVEQWSPRLHITRSMQVRRRPAL
jgi:hypothetical protein